MNYLLFTYHWRHLTRPQLAGFECPVTVENLEYALALHYMYYNFCRIHKTLGKTPAMAVGVADHVWTLEGIVTLVDSK